MDNYLSHRWPGQPVADPISPAEARKLRRKAKKAKKEKKGKRRVWKILLILLLILVLLAGVGVGSWFLAKTLIPRWMDTPVAGDTPPAVTDSAPVQSPQEELSIGTPNIPRSDLEEGVELEVSDVSGKIMRPKAIYEKVLPSVVSVSVYRGEELGYGAGSGVIMREDGYILTNYHVLEHGIDAAVMLLADNSTYPARLVGYDEELDIAILKIEADGLTAAEFGDSDALSVGDAAYAIGNPMGYLYGSMSEGIISFLDRAQTVGEHEMTLIQTTAVLNSGSSGGALVNEHGQVIGITVAKVSGSVDGSALVEGIGFAIPVSAVRPYVNRILSTGESWKPTIGITCYAAELDGKTGIVVVTVEEGTPALEEGLREGDFIIAANGIPVDSVYALKRVLGEVGVGGTLKCTVIRGKFQMDISFPLIDSTDLNQ